MTSLALINACASIGATQILKSVSFEVQSGQMVGLLGPNGAGKTTAARSLLGLQALTSGSALIGGKPSNSFSPRDKARAVAYLPQARKLAWPINVREAIALGRFSYGGPFGKLGAVDANAVDEALLQCDLTGFAGRSVTSLSGGELARVHIGRALAAGASALIADEPIAALDPRHAFDVLALLQAQARKGVAVLVILHDLNLAARFCDEIVLLNQGRLVVQAPPRIALSQELLGDVYGMLGEWRGDDLLIAGRAPQQSKSPV
jgi:iron complex transport system ATP-binding protein